MWVVCNSDNRPPRTLLPVLDVQLHRGPWTPLADTASNPFAGAANVTFPSGAWTSPPWRLGLLTQTNSTCSLKE